MNVSEGSTEFSVMITIILNRQEWNTLPKGLLIVGGFCTAYLSLKKPLQKR